MIGRNAGRLKLIHILMKISDYILNYRDIRDWFKSITLRGWKGAVCSLIVIIAGSKLFGFEGGVFLTFAFILFYWHIDSRTAIKYSLICMVAIPILLIISKNSFTVTEDWAETVAVWAFYFLSIGVIKQIWEYKLESKHNDKI